MNRFIFNEGQWSICGSCEDDSCKCGGVFDVNTDNYIMKVQYGAWGDSYPAIRLTDSSILGQYEVYMETMDYGFVPEENFRANSRLVSKAPDLIVRLKEVNSILKETGLNNSLIDDNDRLIEWIETGEEK